MGEKRADQTGLEPLSEQHVSKQSMRLKLLRPLMLLGFALCFSFIGLWFAKTGYALTSITMSDGEFWMKLNTIASSSRTEYVTTGWTIHRTKAFGRPKLQPHAVVRQLLQTSAEPNPPIPGKLLTVLYRVSEAEIRQALYDAELSSIEERETFYLSAVFQIKENGKILPKTYDNIADIKAARGWKHPEMFDAYFDIAIVFAGKSYPVYQKLRTVEGDLLQHRQMGSAKPGEIITYSFPQKVKHAGVMYVWSESFLQNRHTGEKYHARSVFENQTNAVKVPVGGVDVVGVYSAEHAAKIDVKIESNRPGFDPYKVTQAIPSGEQVYVRATVDRWFIDRFFRHVEGEKTYRVLFRQRVVRRWKQRVDGQWVMRETDDLLKQTVSVRKPYSYWKIDRFKVYQLKHLNVGQYAFAEQFVRVRPPPVVKPLNIRSVKQSFNMREPDIRPIDLPAVIIDGGTAGKPNLSTLEIWDAGQYVNSIRVRNDFLAMNQQNVMNGDWHDSHSPKPVSLVGNRSIFQPSALYSEFALSSVVANGRYPSTCDVVYQSIEMDKHIKKLDHCKVNQVVIHTPIINDTKLLSEQKYVQEAGATSGTNYLVLGRPFAVDFSSIGTHIPVPGYRKRDYVKFAWQKRIRFPFDVVYQKQTIPANRWMIFDSNTKRAEFELPSWVKEGGYQAETAMLTKACTTFACTSQPTANLQRSHHAAHKRLPLKVTGRLLHLRIHQIADPEWKSITTPYTIGGVKPYGLPITPGSHPMPLFANHALKLGTRISFTVDTIGNFQSTEDVVRANVTYFFVSRDGKQRLKVRLFERTTDQQLRSLSKLAEGITMKRGDGHFLGQRWFGSIKLPGGTLVVSEQTDLRSVAKRGPLSLQSPVFLRDGYLVVNMKFSAVQAHQSNSNRLLYYQAPLGNQWRNEGFPSSVRWFGTSVSLFDGDVLFFEADHARSRGYSTLMQH